MGHEEHGGTWHMDAAQLDTQRKKGEAILKTSSTRLQLDRAEKSTVKPEKCCFPLDFPLTLNLILLPRADRLVQASCVLDGESLQALFDEPLGRALKEGEDVASKARLGDKRKDPPAQAPSSKPSQLTMILFPIKFENGKIEYKIRYKGRSRPFSRAKALVTSEQSRDPSKLKELLSQVLTITLDGGTSSTNA
ncbi:unnamed protein product [Microthlaspi erraticum]|uniref:Uncharacterized protein n=1 Tax=Microthlaspi erraticum TaxID=1685480 RepID=A0A6D2HH28_9BRAS|nr:unnamed protein product [Microthlaspi erraticum]